MPFDEPEPEDFPGIKPEYLPPDARTFFNDLREAKKQWRETTDQGVKATAIEKYKVAARSLINYINEFIKN